MPLNVGDWSCVYTSGVSLNLKAVFTHAVPILKAIRLAVVQLVEWSIMIPEISSSNLVIFFNNNLFVIVIKMCQQFWMDHFKITATCYVRDHYDGVLWLQGKNIPN